MSDLREHFGPTDYHPSPEQADILEDYFGALLDTGHSIGDAVTAIQQFWPLILSEDTC